VNGILWRRLDRPGHEAARVDGTSIIGAAAFAHDGEACALAYTVFCDEAWRTRCALVNGFVGARKIEIRIDVDGDRWLLNGNEVEAVRGCIDVDFNFSPSTNLLPIRRLLWRTGTLACPSAPGEEGTGKGACPPLRAAWLRFPSFTLEPLEQTYERLGERTYRYSSATGFTADIEVNEEGLPLRYPGLVEPV
jgi:hypothetical protein